MKNNVEVEILRNKLSTLKIVIEIFCQIVFMDKEIESNFVKNFVIKDKRDRIQFELFSSKKRNQAIQRLYSSLDRKYIIIEDDKIKDDEFLLLIKKFLKPNESCYIIADSRDDGQLLSFDDAFDHMINGCAAYAILCGNDIVIMKDEFFSGSVPKIFLCKRRKEQ